MRHSPSSDPGLALRIPRRYPRAAVNVHVDCRAGQETGPGRAVTIGEGGMLILARHTFPVGAEIVVHFRLPGGEVVDALGLVRYTKPSAEMGLMFIELPEEARKAIARHVAQVRPYARRSARIARQLGILLRWRDLQGVSHEEPALTMSLSRNGGLLACVNRFKPGEDFTLWWPEQNRGAHARVVFRELGSLGSLAAIGFEFVDTENFWQMDFPSESRLWP